jgi:hypothetical protein
MFLLSHSEGCNTSGTAFHWCYANDLHTTPCTGILGHHMGRFFYYNPRQQTTVERGLEVTTPYVLHNEFTLYASVISRLKRTHAGPGPVASGGCILIYFLFLLVLFCLYLFFLWYCLGSSICASF